MNPSTSNNEEPAGVYSLEVLATITGISSETIVEYREHGLIGAGTGEPACFDDETVRTLRRIEHLRDTCEMNFAGLKLLTRLLAEVESLRAALQARR